MNRGVRATVGLWGAALVAGPVSGPVGPPPPTGGPRWAPAPGVSWQWQLTTPVDLTMPAAVFDIDGFENSAAVVEALHRRGRRVICYLEVGTAAEFRPDFDDWPEVVVGGPTDWPGEYWIDIRRLDLVGGVLAARMDMCRDKGFDAVEPDVMDHYRYDTGFAVTASDQLAFNRFVAGLAHDRGLAVALKNDVDQAAELVEDFDFAVNEECVVYRECHRLGPFVAAGKAVLHVEYDRDPAGFCPVTTGLGFSSMRKNRSLDAARWPC